MNINFTYLPGDGIGPEVGAAAMAVLEAAAQKYGHTLALNSILSAGPRLTRLERLCQSRHMPLARRQARYC